MNEKSKNKYIKRTQRDYSMSFKLAVVKDSVQVYNQLRPHHSCFMLTIAELVKESRQRAHMTQEQLASKLNVNRAYISKIERASSDLRISTLRRIIETGFGGKLHIDVEL